MNDIKKPKDIIEEIQKIFEVIKENTGWEPSKIPNDIKIEIGDAPEYYESFGVDRKKDKLIFGNWINEVEPKAISNHFWEFLLIRESFSFFFSENLLFGDISQLVNNLLNLLALSYLQEKDPKSAKDIKFVPIQGRFLSFPGKISDADKELISKINSLIDVINQGISYKMLFNTFVNFIEDISIDEIDQDDVIDDMRRYLSNKPEEIAAPIYLKKNTTEVLLKLVELGYNASAFTIADKLNLNQSTIARQLSKISSKFYAKWRLEKNFFKLGLQTYLLIVRIPLKNKSFLDAISDEILTTKYIDEFYEGRNDQFYFQYAVFSCPNVISERISRKLEKQQNRGIVDSFELKIVKNRIFKTAIVNERFKPTRNNFSDLLKNKIVSKKITLWDFSHHKDVERDVFDKKDISLLKFISVIISKSISKFGLFGAHYSEYLNFIKYNELDLNNISEIINFLNQLQNRVLDRYLIDYRFNISLSGTAKSNILFFIIKSDSKSENVTKIIEKISIFSWILIVESIDEIYLLVLGPDYKHFITKLIEDVLTKNNLKYEVYSTKNKVYRNVAYDELFDYNSQRWSLF